MIGKLFYIAIQVDISQGLVKSLLGCATQSCGYQVEGDATLSR